MEEEAHRNTVKNLTRLFYGPTANGPTTSSQPGSSSSQQRRPRVLKGSHIPSLPLWRVEWVVLPGMQEILHVMAPHYVHLFEQVFAQPRPWVFGHLYLPGGSKSLGAPSHALASGSKAPLVGVLMQVTRAVRLRDGKFLLLATALARFKVASCIRELPFSEADVEVFEDCEHLEGLSTTATAAVLQTAPADTSVPLLMSASTAAAREAAAALHWSWLRGYELQVAAGQEWPGPGPREGENDLETYHMVQELAAQGVADVLPLPDGVVIGRCNLEQVAQGAAAAMQEALREAAVRFTSSSSSSSTSSTDPSSGPGSHQQAAAGGSRQGGNLEDSGISTSISGSSSSGSSGQDSVFSSSEGGAVIASLNTVAERGVTLQDPEAEALTATISCGTTEEVLMLEAAVWQQLDILAALSTRVNGTRHSLPFGLLQLRPPRPQLSVEAATLLANQAAAAQATDQTDAAADSSSNPGSSSKPSSVVSGAMQPGHGHPPAARVAPDADDAGSAGASSSQADPAGAPHSSSSSKSGDGTGSSSKSGGSISSLSSRSSADPAGQYLSASKYAFAASEGMDVHADPLWPPLRRAAKLSWAAALVTGDPGKDLATSDLRQALLETPSIASRLRYVLAVLQKHAKVLAAHAAVKDLQE